jgi:ketosteroid isomerase-like protein
MPDESTTPDLRTLVRRATDVWTSEIEDPMSFFAPDSVWDMSRGGLGVIEGREAIHEFFEEWRGAYEDYEQEAEEILDLGNGVAFAVFVQRGRPSDSTGWVEFRDARVMLWADGLMERVTTFLDIDEARAAAERLAEERGEAVSEENVETLRRLYRRWEQGDFFTPEAFDPQVEFVRTGGPENQITSGCGHGLDAMWGALVEWAAGVR